MTINPVDTIRKYGYKKLKLSHIVGLALATMNSVAGAAALSVTGGIQLDLPDSAHPQLNYEVSNDTGFLISGKNGEIASQISGQGLNLTVTGSGTAASIQNGGRLILTDSVLNMTGAGGKGIDVSGKDSYAELSGSASSITTSNGFAVSVSGGASAVLNGTTINTGNTTAFLWSSGNGSSLTLDNANVTSAGGTIQIDNGGKVAFTDSNIHMGPGAANQATGGISMTGGSIELNNSRLETEGRAAAVNLSYNSSIKLIDSTIITHGSNANALFAPSSQSAVTATNSNLETYGAGAVAIDARGGVTSLTGGSIITHGSNSHALYASQDAGNGTVKISATDLNITTYGAGAVGAMTRIGGSTVELDHVSINTAGDSASGLYATGTGAVMKVQNSSVHTTGTAAYGIQIANPSLATLTNSQLYTSGQDSAALFSWHTIVTSAANDVSVTNSVLDTQNAAAMILGAGTHQVTLDHSTVTGRNNAGDGTAIWATDITYNGTPVPLDSVNITAKNGTEITGDVSVSTGNANSTFNLSLSDNSSLTGAVNATQGALTLDDTSQWNVRGDSTLNTLTSSGNINYLPPVAGTFKTVTVNGNYNGGGTLTMNVALANDNSAGDKLIVNGDTSGTTGVRISNAGGNGGLTGNGIELVHVGGSSDGVFNQQGRVIVAGYEYTLYKGSLSNPNDGNWYLRSVALPTPDPGPTPGPAPQPTPDPVQQWTSPLVGAYLGNQTAAVNMFSVSLHDRLGEPQFTQNLDGRRPAPSAWIRVVGNQEKSKAAGQTLDLDTDNTIVQLGSDVALWSNDGNNRWHLGWMAGYGHSKTDASNPKDYGKDNLRNAKGTVDGYSIGAYATWFGNASQASGPYVDTWLQYGWYDNDVSASGEKTDSYKSRNLSASVEAGYAFKLSDNGSRQWLIEPQAQVIFNSYDADDHYTAYGDKVHDSDTDGVTTRVGARVYSRVVVGNGIQPFIEANWLHGDADNSLQLSNGGYSNRFSQDIPKDRYELKAGVQAALTKNLHGWASFGWQTGDNSYQRLEGLAGVKYVW